MPTLGTYMNRVRSYLRDWPTTDTLTAAIATTSAGSFTVTDATAYTPNWLVQVDQEALTVGSIGSATVVIARRGQRGTTAASHANGTTILIRPAFLDSEIIDAINDGIDACFPLVYKEVLDTSLTITDAQTYEYTVPYLPSTTVYMPYISKIETKETGDYAWRETTRWEIRRGATPKIKFHEVGTIVSAQVRVHGYGPFPHLSATTDSMDAQWPANAEFLPVLYAAGTLLASGEAGRVRQDTGARDDREAANRPGSSSASGRDLLQRFTLRLGEASMPPLPPHVVSVF